MNKEEKIIEQELEEIKSKAEEYLNNWKRERADFINYKKDERKRLDKSIEFGKQMVIENLLDIKDDLEMALKSNESDDIGGYRNGIEMILKKFDSLFDLYQVKRISTDGKFDPNVHEAIEVEPGGEKIQELRAGYTMHDRVIRPARIRLINNKNNN